jgi:flagellar hook-associated protein 2
MIWNALQAETVEYASTGVNVSAGDVSISVGASAATPTGDTLAVTAYHDAIGTDEKLTADAFGRPITVYTLGGDIDDGGTKLATEVATPAATYTTAVASGTIYTDLGLTSGTTGTAVTNITHNGTDTTTASFTVARNVQTPVPDSGNGVVTEVYTNNKGVPTCIVTITPTYGTLAITTGKETNGSTYQLYTVTDSEDSTVSGKVYTSALNGEEDTVVLNGTVAKGDHVTFYTATENGTTTVYITPVTKVTATMTGSKTTTTGTVYTIGGESKSLSAANGAAATLTGFNSEATFELDAYGYVLAKSDSDDTVYLFVAAASEVNTLVGTKVVASYAADVVDTDGVVSTVTVSKVDDTAVTDEAQIVVNTLYTAEKDAKGNYVLTTVDGQGSSDHNNIALTAGAPDVDDIKANNATKFVTLNFDSEDAFDGTVTTVTGLANITTATGVSLVYVDTDDDGIANIVYIFDAGSASADAITFAYYTGASTYDGATDTTTYTFIVDGVETEIKGTTGLDGAKLYSISAANAATAVEFGTTANTKASAAVVNKGGLLYSGDTYVTTVTDSVPVYVISNGAVETLTAADLSTAVTGALAYTVANGAVTSIVIVVPAE